MEIVKITIVITIVTRVETINITITIDFLLLSRALLINNRRFFGTNQNRNGHISAYTTPTHVRVESVSRFFCL